MSGIKTSEIEKMIYWVRGKKVLLDNDLSLLYGVSTKRLNEQVKRNKERFPTDFMFQLTRDEREILRSQFATFNKAMEKRKYLPYVFTEQGVAMLSSVLNSKEAIKVNIAIMRIFVKLRYLIEDDETTSERIKKLEVGSKEMENIFKIVFKKLAALEGKLPVYAKDRKKIGLK